MSKFKVGDKVTLKKDMVSEVSKIYPDGGIDVRFKYGGCDFIKAFHSSQLDLVEEHYKGETFEGPIAPTVWIRGMTHLEYTGEYRIPMVNEVFEGLCGVAVLDPRDGKHWILRRVYVPEIR